jgi:hypothetical protein
MDKTIKWYRLGYNPTDTYMKSEDWGFSGKKIWLPHGIVIPCFIDKKLWHINIRRPSGNPKYFKIRGSRQGLFGAINLRGSWLVLLTEGEFDAMLADQEIGDVAGVATLGSAIRKIDLATWGSYLLPARVILVAQDSDRAGQKAKEALSNLSPQIHPIRVPVLSPGDKDITDYFKAVGDLWEWLKYHLLQLGLIHRPFPPNIFKEQGAHKSGVVLPSNFTRFDLSAIVADHLDKPPQPDISQPCFACNQLAWKERPSQAGGGWYCGFCHPS